MDCRQSEHCCERPYSSQNLWGRGWRQIPQKLSTWQPSTAEPDWDGTCVFLTPSNLRMDLRQCHAPPYGPRGEACSLTFTCSRVFFLSSALSGKVMGNAFIERHGHDQQ